MATNLISQRRVHANFINALNTSLRIYAPVRECCVWSYESINESDFHPRVAAKIVGLAFLSVVVGWEEYVEESFLRYMCGAYSECGYAPKLRIGRCRNTSHARQVLGGASRIQDGARFLRWNDFGWVMDAATVYFDRGKPYSLVSSRFRTRLADAQIIRNRIAHASPKARSQFRKMINRLVGAEPMSPMDKGFSPGQFLIHRRPDLAFEKAWLDAQDHHYWGDVFEAFVSMFSDLADLITPPKRTTNE